MRGRCGDHLHAEGRGQPLHRPLRCISPWPASTVSPMSASWRSDQAGILLDQLLQRAGKAHVVLAVGGGDGERIDRLRRLREGQVQRRPHRPAARRWPRPRAGRAQRSRRLAASVILVISPLVARHMPPMRLPSSVAPSFTGPRQTRAHVSLPPKPAFSVRKICTSGPPVSGTPRRSAVIAAVGASWRSAFHSRRMPWSRSAQPSSTSVTWPSASTGAQPFEHFVGASA